MEHEVDRLVRARTSSEPLQGVEVSAALASDLPFTTTDAAGKPILPRWIRVAGAGNLKVDAIDRAGAAQTGILLAFTDNEAQPIGCITKIYSTGNGSTVTGPITVGF